MTAIADAAKAVLDAYYAGTARPAFVTIAVPRIDGEATPTSDRLETEIRAAAKDHSRKPDVRFLRVELRSVAATGLSFIVAGMGG